MSEKVVPLRGFGGGGTSLNFKVLAYPTEEALLAATPRDNTIGVVTDQKITSWHFSAEEPNVYAISVKPGSSTHNLLAPHKVSAGDIFNFIIPADVTSIFEAIRITDPYTNKYYAVRYTNKGAPTSWIAGTRVGIKISDEINTVGSWGGNGTAYLYTIGFYYHEERVVWFPTGTSSVVAFNALKKDTIMVYPLSAKQYINGAWVEVTAKSYQGGEWVDWWNGELYTPGNEWSNFTGGWTARGWIDGGNLSSATPPTVNKNSNCMDITQVGQYACGVVEVRKDQDLSNINYLQIDCEGTSNDCFIDLIVINRTETTCKTSVASVSLVTRDASVSRQTFTVDTSSITGHYDIAIRFTSGTMYCNGNLKMYSLCMVK